MTKLSKLSRSIEGRVAIITGAASGMGRATAYVFADAGARLALVDRNAEGVAAVADEVNKAGGSARHYAADLADGAAIPALVAQIRADVGPIDILVNNAGISLPAPIEHDAWEKAWELTLAVNLTAQARLIRACVPDLARNGDGRVVNISSTEGLGATGGASPYTAAKHGVIGLTRSMAVELGPRGINVNAVCPGPIRTAMTAGIPDEAKTIYAKRRVALKRYGEPEEVAHATLSLVLPAASFITGAYLVVDGGMSIRNA
jgi:3-oxoacyl-[acyl-carrier protein] reductase